MTERAIVKETRNGLEVIEWGHTLQTANRETFGKDDLMPFKLENIAENPSFPEKERQKARALLNF